MNIKQALLDAKQQLPSQEQAALEASVLLAHILQRDKVYLIAHGEEILTASQQQQLSEFITRRQQGEPIAYITGEREFWSLPLQVNDQVLIPRPETELLVEKVLAYLPKEQQLIADLGTGSGAIALALARERPQWLIHATDSSVAALSVAKTNAENLACPNIQFFSGDWCAALPAKGYDAIISNPPYIDATDPHLQMGDVQFEPRTALVAEQQGLADLEKIIIQAQHYLRPQGYLLLEHGYQQAAAVVALLQANHYMAITTYLDLAGHDRISIGCRI